jgi:phospholipid/cholesterol/gamma-HCH transport system substrate-binding protein
VSSISLKGGSLEGGGVPVAEDGVPTLTADPNAIQDIGEAVRGVLQNVNKLVLDNQEALKSSMANVEVFSKSLASNSARIDSIMSGVDGLMGEKASCRPLRARSVNWPTISTSAPLVSSSTAAARWPTSAAR